MYFRFLLTSFSVAFTLAFSLVMIHHCRKSWIAQPIANAAPLRTTSGAPDQATRWINLWSVKRGMKGVVPKAKRQGDIDCMMSASIVDCFGSAPVDPPFEIQPGRLGEDPAPLSLSIRVDEKCPMLIKAAQSDPGIFACGQSIMISYLYLGWTEIRSRPLYYVQPPGLAIYPRKALTLRLALLLSRPPTSRQSDTSRSKC